MQRRSARLFQLVTVLRGRRRAMTAATLAVELGVAKRTVYRDVQALVQSGVPIAGEAGVGYLLDPSYELPPLRFSFVEITAMLVGKRLVQAFTDPELAAAARSAEAKILAILTPTERRRVAALPYRAPVVPSCERETHATLRKACEGRWVLRVRYHDLFSRREQGHVLRPLCLLSWGDHWSLLAYSETEADYRNLRVDRLLEIERTGARFVPEPGRSLDHFVAEVLGATDDQKPGG